MVMKGLFLLWTTFTSASATNTLVTDLRHSYKIQTSAKKVAQALKSQFGDKKKPLRVVEPWLEPVDVSDPTITGPIALALWKQDTTGILTGNVVAAITFSGEKIYPWLYSCITAHYKHITTDIFILLVVS